MAQSEAVTGARGQLVWIVALVLSITAIIYLERVDLGQPGQSALVSAGLAASASEALAAADARYKASADPQSAANLVLALCAAAQAGALEMSQGRARADALRDQAAAAPDGQAVAILADLTFGR